MESLAAPAGRLRPMSDDAGLQRPGPLRLDATALFLDLDGTLTPMAARPQDVGPHGARNALLRALAVRLDGRLAMVSGRTLADIDRILDGAARAAAGVHGLERRRADGTILRVRPSPELPAARLALEAFAAAHPGVRIEDKRLSLAVHFRATPGAGPAAIRAARSLAGRGGLVLQLGDHIAELRTPGPDKGAAIHAFMAEPPFIGARPVFVGDDLTDEAGFAAARALGGVGVLVGPARPTAATRQLDGVDAVLAWLRAAIDGAAP